MLANGNTIICLACQDNSRNFGNFKYLETKILKLCLLEKWREKEQEENPKYSQQIGWGWDQWEPTPGARTTVQVSSVGAPHRCSLTCCLQGLHWQEADLGNKRQASNHGTLIWVSIHLNHSCNC